MRANLFHRLGELEKITAIGRERFQVLEVTDAGGLEDKKTGSIYADEAEAEKAYPNTKLLIYGREPNDK